MLAQQVLLTVGESPLAKVFAGGDHLLDPQKKNLACFR